MKKIIEHFDLGSMLIIFVTFILFAIALFSSGFTHDLFLEAGVLLVSVKLIIMAYKNSRSNKEIMQELHAIKKLLGKR